VTFLHSGRMALQRLGIDITRYPAQATEYGAHRAFVMADPDLVLDVGANRGQFATQLRRLGYTGQIASFEPGAQAFDALLGNSRTDARWSAHKIAVGNATGEVTLHIAANDGASSSILNMLDAHRSAAPAAQFVADEVVQLTRLDEFAGAAQAVPMRPALKIDTQGFERQVLEGCGAWLDQMVSVRLELSIVELYEGSWLWREAADWLTGRGLELAAVIPGFSDPTTGRMLQFDGIFSRVD
jgi:FkbM family methyltransferase